MYPIHPKISNSYFVPSASAAVPTRIKIGPQAGGMGAGGGLPRAGRQGGRPGRGGGAGKALEGTHLLTNAFNVTLS